MKLLAIFYIEIMLKT